MKNRKIIGIIIVILIAVVLIFVLRKKDITNFINEDISIASVEKIAESLKDDIKSSLNEVEKDYKDVKSNYSQYTRYDIYSSEKINEYIDEVRLSFVDLNKIDIDEIYSITGKKVNDLDGVYKINANLQSLDNDLKFENNRYYLLKAEQMSNDINIYYIVAFSSKGIEDIQPVFCTQGEDSLIDNLEEDVEQEMF